MRMKGRSSIIIACFLAVGQATKSMADYSTTINAPTLKSGASYAIGATIQYGGTVSWLTGNVAAMYVGVDWAYGSAATYTDSVSNNSLGIGDSESANIASTKAYSLTFQSDGYTDYNKIYHQPVPLTANQVNGNRYYYYVVATPYQEGHAPLLGVSPGTVGWYYCQ